MEGIQLYPPPQLSGVGRAALPSQWGGGRTEVRPHHAVGSALEGIDEEMGMFFAAHSGGGCWNRSMEC